MNDDNVIPLRCVTTLDIPPEKVLNGAITQELTDVVIIGWGKGGDLYFASSYGNGAETNWLIDQAKIALLEMGRSDSDER